MGTARALAGCPPASRSGMKTSYVPADTKMLTFKNTEVVTALSMSPRSGTLA